MMEVEIEMKKYRPYRKTKVQLMRPYVKGENMAAIDVPRGVTPEVGGMIAIDPSNPKDKWYVTPKLYSETYEATE